MGRAYYESDHCGNLCEYGPENSPCGMYFDKEHLKRPNLQPAHDGPCPSVAMFRVDSAASSSSGATFSTTASSSLSSCTVSTGTGVPVMSLGHLASLADVQEACEKLDQLRLVNDIFTELNARDLASTDSSRAIILPEPSVPVPSPSSLPLAKPIPENQHSLGSCKAIRTSRVSLQTIPEIVGVAILPETPASIERHKLLPTLSETLGNVGLHAQVDIVALEAELPTLSPFVLPSHLRRRRRSVQETGTASSLFAVSSNGVGASSLSSTPNEVGGVTPSYQIIEGARMLDCRHTFDLRPDSAPVSPLPEKRQHKVRSNLKLGNTPVLNGLKSPSTGTGQVRVRFAS